MTEQVVRKKVLMGTVVSDKMNKTIVVRVTRQVRHKLYQKFLKKSKKYHVHDEANKCGIGDVVRIAESRPYSKKKTWILVEVLERAE